MTTLLIIMTLLGILLILKHLSDRSYFWNLKQDISNLIYYYKVIKNDRQWQEDFIEDILIAKYERMIAYDNIQTKWGKMNHTSLKALKLAIRLLYRIKDIRENDYYNNDRIQKYWNIYCELIKKYHFTWWS